MMAGWSFVRVLPSIAAIFVLLLVAPCRCHIEITNGTGGIECGEKVCVPEARCTANNTCVCDIPPYVRGNGYFKCFSALELGAFMANDPILTTFESEHANLAIPCRYQLTELTTQFLDDNLASTGICSFELRPFNRKDKGKFYVYGFDLAVRAVFNTGTVWKYSVRKFGTAMNGTYTFQVNVTDGLYSVDGPFNDDSIDYVDATTGIKFVDCTFDYENNYGFINISYCGICVRFRPYDLVLRRNAPMTPGLSIAVQQDYGPFFINDDASLALVPPGFSWAVAMADLPLQVSNTADIIYRSLTNMVTQVNPDPNPWCMAAGLILLACPTLVEARAAFNSCLWMMESPKFIRCFDSSDNGEGIMELFNNCTEIACHTRSCASVMDSVSLSGCQPHDPTNTDLQLFIAGGLCP